MSEVQVFKHAEFGQHTVRTDERGNAVFVLNPVAEALDYSRGRDARRVLDRDEYWTEVVDLPAQDLRSSQVRRRVTVISESGLYHLIFASTKPEAKVFRRWVTEELLPTLRKASEVGIDALAEMKERVAKAEWQRDKHLEARNHAELEAGDYMEEHLLLENGFVRVLSRNGRFKTVRSYDELKRHRRQLASVLRPV